MKPKVISLFSGAMGLDIGLSNAGLDIVIGQDFDANCVATMKANGHKVLEGDIRIITSGELLELAGLKKGEPFMICGGPPCQPFSTAGKRMGINDPRGSLFMDYVRMVDEIRPRFFVFENVKGLLSTKLRDESGKILDSYVFDVILDEFSKLKYKLVYGVLDAVDYGVPEFRERLIIIGSRDNEEIFLPLPTHFPIHQSPAYRWQTLGNAIKDLENNPGDCASFSPERAKYLELIPEGGNWKDLPAELLPMAMGGALNSGGGKVGFYRRLSYSQPSPTVVTSPVQKATMMCHPTQLRPLSVKEYARIQQFPEHWIFTGTLASQYRQIGNAVPVGLAKAIGEAILATAMGNAEVKTKRMRGTSTHTAIFNNIGLYKKNKARDNNAK